MESLDNVGPLSDDDIKEITGEDPFYCNFLCIEPVYSDYDAIGIKPFMLMRITGEQIVCSLKHSSNNKCDGKDCIFQRR